MGDYGQLMVCIAAACSAIGGCLALVSHDRPHYLDAGRRMLFAAGVASLASLLILVFLLCSHDYRIAYVRDYADRTMSIGYLVAAVWGGKGGSLLVWAGIQTWYTAAVALNRQWSQRNVLRFALGFLAAIQVFFLLLVLFHSNPFAPLGTIADQGIGMNPLLRNPYMAVHPPTLFLGFAGFSVPLAFAFGAFADGKTDGVWLAELRGWILFAWVFLSIGNLLGMLWAYEELGWGGYWGWDPVENASFMPWLTGTALVHSALAQKRTGGFGVWNFALIVVTFALIIFGTFLTRSGIIESVHAFAGSTTGPHLLGFIIVILVLGGGLMVLRLSSVRRTDSLQSWYSKEAIVLVTNWAFVLATIGVWLGTMAPFFSDLLKGEKLTLTPEAFNRGMVPLGLLIFGLIGLCTAYNWRSTPFERGIRFSRLPLIVGLIAAAAAALVNGLGSEGGLTGGLAPILSFALIGVISAMVIKRSIPLLKRSADQRRNTRLTYQKLGAQLVHLSVVLLFVGFTGAAFTKEHRRAMNPGEAIRVDDVRVEFLGLRTDADFERQAVYADLNVSTGSADPVVLSPARFIYHTHPRQPTSEVVIRTSLTRDLFLILGEPDLRFGRAVVRLVVNPLVVWIWLGGLVMVIGVMVAFPQSGWLERWREAYLRHRQKVGWIGFIGVAVTIAVIGIATTRDLPMAIIALLVISVVGLVLFLSSAVHELLLRKGPA